MDDDETTDFPGILANLGAQPGGLLGGLFPPPPAYDPRQHGGLPPGADPTAISLAAAASAAEFARTLRNIDHQAVIMAALGKAMGAPGTRSTAAQGGDAGPSTHAETPDAPSPGPVLVQRAPARATPAAPVNASMASKRNPVPLPMATVPQWPIPGTVEQRWATPGAEIPDSSALLQGIAAIPSAAKPAADNFDWSRLAHGTVNVPLPDPSQAGLENPDASTLSQDVAAVPSHTWPKTNLPTLQRYGIDSDDLISRIVGAENASQNPSAKNPSSSATGLTQFTKGTWPDVLKNYKRDLYDWFSPDPDNKKRLELRFDPALSRQMAGAYADQNAKALADAHLPVTYANIYLAHHFGAEGAKRILTSDPNALAPSVVSTKALQDNNWITPTMAARDLIQWAEGRMEHGAGWRRPSH